jgi:hypothetical protein
MTENFINKVKKPLFMKSAKELNTTKKIKISVKNLTHRDHVEQKETPKTTKITEMENEPIKSKFSNSNLKLKSNIYINRLII